MKPTGTTEITHSISVNGSYYINKYFELNGQIMYKYILNSNHQKNKNIHGVEFDIAMAYKVF